MTETICKRTANAVAVRRSRSRDTQQRYAKQQRTAASASETARIINARMRCGAVPDVANDAAATASAAVAPVASNRPANPTNCGIQLKRCQYATVCDSRASQIIDFQDTSRAPCIRISLVEQNIHVVLNFVSEQVCPCLWCAVNYRVHSIEYLLLMLQFKLQSPDDDRFSLMMYGSCFGSTDGRNSIRPEQQSQMLVNGTKKNVLNESSFYGMNT